MSNGKENPAISRRNFGAILAATGAAPAILAQEDPQHQAGVKPSGDRQQGPSNFRRPLAPDTPPFEGPLRFTRKDISLKAESFPMAQVRLSPGSVFYEAQEWNRGYMSRLPADRLLYCA